MGQASQAEAAGSPKVVGKYHHLVVPVDPDATGFGGPNLVAALHLEVDTSAGNDPRLG
jgi:hypothetical protein